jgi:hypothetical protein
VINKAWLTHTSSLIWRSLPMFEQLFSTHFLLDSNIGIWTAQNRCLRSQELYSKFQMTSLRGSVSRFAAPTRWSHSNGLFINGHRVKGCPLVRGRRQVPICSWWACFSVFGLALLRIDVSSYGVVLLSQFPCSTTRLSRIKHFKCVNFDIDNGIILFINWFLGFIVCGM